MKPQAHVSISGSRAHIAPDRTVWALRSRPFRFDSTAPQAACFQQRYTDVTSREHSIPGAFKEHTRSGNLR